jgi:hypothetical protein
MRKLVCKEAELNSCWELISVGGKGVKIRRGRWMVG